MHAPAAARCRPWHRVRGSPTAPGKCVFPADCTRRTCTLPRVRSAVVLPTEGDPRRIRSLQPVQPAVLLLTAGHRRRTHSLLPVQPAVLFTCGGCSQFLYIPPYLRVVSTIMDFMIRIMIDKIQDCVHGCIMIRMARAVNLVAVPRGRS